MRKVLISLSRVALCATFCLLTMLMVVPTKAIECKDVNIIFMRGSSQNYSPHNNEDINYPDWELTQDKGIQFKDYRYNKQDDKEPAFVTYEKESLKYFKDLGDRIRLDYPKLTYQFVSVHDFAGKYNANGYRAVPAFGSAPFFVSRNAVDAKFGESPLIDEVVYGDYTQSVQDGAEELAGYLEDQMLRCPSQLPVVGGFSQGAHVVGEAVRLLHERGKDNLLSRLGHVDLYGDPKFLGYEQTTNRLNPLKKHVTMPWTRGAANQLLAGSLGPRKPYVPDILFDKTTSWCDLRDIVCGGLGALNVFTAKEHGFIYNEDNGYIDKSANEIYVSIKKRLGLLAGVKDKSANSPLAYWDGIKKPQKLDIVFVMDRTGDENISLEPDPEYTLRNLAYLAEEGYSSFQVGVVTYTEFARFDGTKDIIESVVKTPVPLTDDLFGTYSAFRDGWGRAHFQNPPYGGEDLQDSPFSALDTALDMAGFRSDARKVVVVFSNSYGKAIEDTTELTAKKITSKAKKKNVEILPVFTSKTFRSDEAKVQKVPDANAFWTTLAKGSSGHHTEITDGISETLLHDVIMGHVLAPDVEISMGKTYNTPKTTTTTKKTANSTVKGTKVVVAKGKKVVLSASKTTSAKNKIIKYSWDLNGDGIPDTTSTTPDVEHQYDDDFDGEVCVEAQDEDGVVSTGCLDVGTTDDEGAVTHEEPEVLELQNTKAVRSGSDLVVTWKQATGTVVIYATDGRILAIVPAMNGTTTLREVPVSAFSIELQLVDGNDMSERVRLQIDASLQQVTAANDQTTTSTKIDNESEDETFVLQGSDGLPDTTVAGLVVDDADTSVLGTNTDRQEKTPLGDLRSLLASAASRMPHVNIAGLYKSIIGSTRLKVLFTVTLGSIVFLWLLLLLFLFLLAAITKDKRKQKYEHDKKYTYTSKALRSIYRVG